MEDKASTSSDTWLLFPRSRLAHGWRTPRRRECRPTTADGSTSSRTERHSEGRGGAMCCEATLVSRASGHRASQRFGLPRIQPRRATAARRAGFGGRRPLECRSPMLLARCAPSPGASPARARARAGLARGVESGLGSSLVGHAERGRAAGGREYGARAGLLHPHKSDARQLESAAGDPPALHELLADARWVQAPASSRFQPARRRLPATCKGTLTFAVVRRCVKKISSACSSSQPRQAPAAC